MPPKRKRAEADKTAESSTTRLTKKSSRATRGNNGVADVTDNDSVEPSTKKIKATNKKSDRDTRVLGPRLDDKPLNSTSQQHNNDEPDIPKQVFNMVEYTPQRAQALFKRFADDDDPDVIGPGGVEKLCKEAGIPLEGAQPLILAWQFGAQEIAKLTSSEWNRGTDILRIPSLPALAIALKELDDLIIHDKEVITPVSTLSSVKKRDVVDLPELYNRARYWQYAANRNTTFTELYQFCFTLSKTPQSRNIDVETAIALWSVLLAPRYPIITEVIEFLNETGSYKGVNKDIWNMVHEFCQTVNGNLSTYEADGAWPTMLDDFVVWGRDRMPRSSDNTSVPMDK